MGLIRLLIDFKTKIEDRSRREGMALLACSLLFMLLLALDLLSKVWAESYLHEQHNVIYVIPGFFTLLYVTNKGAAWGIFHGYTFFLLCVAVAVVGVAILYFRKLTEGYIERYYALSIMFSGIIGNAIDRLWRGHVVDFLDFNFWGYHFPTFNVADCCICVGVGIYILSSLLRPQPEKKAQKSAEK